MAYKPKGEQISFRVEDDLRKQMEKAADLEGKTLADFVRVVFNYGFFRYQVRGLFALQQEQHEALLARQAELNQQARHEELPARAANPAKKKIG